MKTPAQSPNLQSPISSLPISSLPVSSLPNIGTNYRFPVRFFLVHTLEHSVEHRTEVKVALAQLGIDTPDLDAWEYATEAGYGQPVEEE